MKNRIFRYIRIAIGVAFFIAPFFFLPQSAEEEEARWVAIATSACWGIAMAEVFLELFLYIAVFRKKQVAVMREILNPDVKIIGISYFGKTPVKPKKGEFAVSGFATSDVALVRGFYEGDDENIERGEQVSMGNAIGVSLDDLSAVTGKTVFVSRRLYEEIEEAERYTLFLHQNTVEIYEER